MRLKAHWGLLPWDGDTSRQTGALRQRLRRLGQACHPVAHASSSGCSRARASRLGLPAPYLKEHVRHDQRVWVVEMAFQIPQQLLELSVLDQILVEQAIPQI